jgi:hypothetical protein
LVESSGDIPTPPNTPVHFVPQLFDWGHIWTVRRPIEWVNVIIGEKILTNTGYMGPGVILLENYVMLLNKWNCNMPEDFIPISYAC